MAMSVNDRVRNIYNNEILTIINITSSWYLCESDNGEKHYYTEIELYPDVNIDLD